MRWLVYFVIIFAIVPKTFAYEDPCEGTAAAAIGNHIRQNFEDLSAQDKEQLRYIENPPTKKRFFWIVEINSSRPGLYDELIYKTYAYIQGRQRHFIAVVDFGTQTCDVKSVAEVSNYLPSRR